MWEAYNIPPRPFSAEDGLVLVKQDLYARGIPVAYMQLDDWWYNGAFYCALGARGTVARIIDAAAPLNTNTSRPRPFRLAYLQLEMSRA